MMDIITKQELKELMDRLENGIDKFILAGCYYGLNDNDYREQFLNLKSSQVNLENSTITLQNGRVIVMDSLLKKVVEEAMTQEVYKKIGAGSSQTNEEYALNKDCPYIIKVKPLLRNNYGMESLKNAGFKKRIRTISEELVGDTSITPTLLRRSGAFNMLLEQNRPLKLIESEQLLKENGLCIRRNNLSELLKEVNKNYE